MVVSVSRLTQKQINYILEDLRVRKVSFLPFHFAFAFAFTFSFFVLCL